MALAVVFDNWDGDLEGSIYCECFFTRTYRCERCLNRQFITIQGPYLNELGGRAHEYLETVQMVVRALQGETPFPRCPTDTYDQPAKWIEAFYFLQPYASLEIREYLKRCQER